MSQKNPGVTNFKPEKNIFYSAHTLTSVPELRWSHLLNLKLVLGWFITSLQSEKNIHKTDMCDDEVVYKIY
jgi:hypothetical protein